MASIREVYQTADFKVEKHVPVIEAADTVTKGQEVAVSVSVGKQIPHPNTAEHHIAWVELYFHPKAEKFPYQVARVQFAAHGASAQGPNTSTVFTQPSITCIFKTEKTGTLYATSYCNIHGLWESAKELTVG